MKKIENMRVFLISVKLCELREKYFSTVNVIVQL